MIGFSFFKVMPEWRRLPAAERTEHKRLFAEVLARWNQPGRLLSLTYSTVGLRPDCDMALWRICYSVDDLSEMMAELMATPLGGYLQLANNYISMTKRSPYLIGHEHEGLHGADVERAHAAGLRCRPVSETVADTWAWMGSLEGPPPLHRGLPAPGLDPDAERAALALAHAAG